MSWEPINLASSKFEQPSEPPSIAGLVYTGRRHALSGPPESLKTLVALIVALEHVRAGGKVAYIDFEMGPVTVRRMLDDLGATPDELRAFSYFEPEGPPTLEDLETITTEGITLAIIDAAAGAYDASGLDDNKRADAERFAATWVKPFWITGVTTMLLDHVVKNPDNRGKYAIGSERKLGGVDVHLGLDTINQLSRGTTGVVRVTTHKDRPGHLPRPTAAELELRSDRETHAITWDFRTPAGTSTGDGWRPTILMDRVLEHVSRPDYEPVARTALVDAVKGNRAWLFQAIDHLIADGKLELDGKRVVNSSGTVPGTVPADENGNVVPSSHSLQGGTVLGTVFEAEQTELE